MPTTATPPTPSAAELVARANAYFDLEVQIAGFIATQPQRRTAEQARLVSDLLTATQRTPASVATRFEAYETALKVLVSQTREMKALLSVLEHVTDDFAKANRAAIKLAIEQQRAALAQLRTKDAQDRTALASQIKTIEARLRRFEAIA